MTVDQLTDGTSAQPQKWMKRSATAAIWLVAFLLVLVPRSWFIAKYGSSVPYWDQWGAELQYLYKPIVEGTFSWPTLWAAHNEHRIVLPRLWFIGLFEANQLQADPIVELFASNLVVALTSACAMLWIRKHIERLVAIGVCAALLALLLVPNGWGNMLVGFQICFYFLAIFGVLAIGVAARSSGSAIAVALLAFLFVAAQLSLAAGLLIFPAIIIVLAIRLWSKDISPRPGTFLLAFVVAAFAVAYATIPSVTLTEGARATDLAEFVKSLTITMAWPFSSLVGLLCWIPTFYCAIRSIFYRTIDRVESVFLGVALWILILCIAIAYTRGHFLGEVESRYTELLGLGLIANGFLAVRVMQQWFGTGRNILRSLVPVFIFTGIIWSFSTTHRVVVAEWKDWSGRMRVATSNVSRYLAGEQDALENRPLMYIPSPSAESKGLAGLLSDPTIRSLLPFSLLPLGTTTAGSKLQACSWMDGGFTEISSDGSIRCQPKSANVSTLHVGVGRLSVVAYSVWELLGKPGISKATSMVPSATAYQHAMFCSLDSVNDVARPNPEISISYGGAVKIVGWAGPRGIGEPTRFNFRSNESGEFVATIISNLARQDVVEFLNDTRFEQAGYAAWIDASALPVGRYMVTLSTADTTECNTGHFIEIKAMSDPRIAY